MTWWNEHDHGVTLVRRELKTYVDAGELEHGHIDPPMTVYRLQVEVTDAFNMPTQIFLYHKGPEDPVNPEYTERFDRVCDFGNLTEYPINNPDNENPNKFYRKSIADLVFYDLDELERVYSVIKEDVESLVDSIYAVRELVVTETNVYGTMTELSSSSSSDSSETSSTS